MFLRLNDRHVSNNCEYHERSYLIELLYDCSNTFEHILPVQKEKIATRLCEFLLIICLVFEVCRWFQRSTLFLHFVSGKKKTNVHNSKNSNVFSQKLVMSVSKVFAVKSNSPLKMFIAICAIRMCDSIRKSIKLAYEENIGNIRWKRSCTVNALK